MDVDIYLTESASFTRAVLMGKYSRWLIFILLGLPWTVLVSLLASRHVIEGMTVHWSLIPWTESGLLIVTGTLCNFILTGYIVRLLAGGTTPPEFSAVSRLVLDGIKVHIIPLAWLFVPVLLGLLEFLLVTYGYSGTLPGLGLIVIIFIFELLVVLFAVKYAVIGIVRFARTGSVREAFDLPAIKETYDRIGWVNYYIGLGVIALVFILMTGLLNLVALIPVAGPVVTLALGPLVTVYTARFIAHFCDDDTYGTRPEETPLPLRRIIPEFLAWSALLVVLAVLCFSPLVVVSGALLKILP